MEEIKVVEKQQEPATTPPVPPVEDNTQKVIEALEQSDKALAAAETKIVSLKREKKSVETSEDPDLAQEILSLRDEVRSLKENKSPDKELEDLKVARGRIGELTEALRAKNSSSNTSLGSSQTTTSVEEDPLKGFTSQELSVIERRATALGISPAEYAKRKKGNLR